MAFFVPFANSVFLKHDFGETNFLTVEGTLETPGLSPLVKQVRLVDGDGLTRDSDSGRNRSCGATGIINGAA